METQLYHSWAYTQKVPYNVIEAHAPLCSYQLYLESLNVEVKRMSHIRRMDTDSVVNLHDGILFSS